MLPYQRCAILGPNRSCKSECFSSSSWPGSYTRDVSIQFISSTLAFSPHEMDERINGCMWLVRVSWAWMRQGLLRSLSFFTRIHEYVVRRAAVFFSLVSLSFIRSFPHSLSLLLHSCPSVTPSTRKPLCVVWKYTFIFEESYGWTGRHVSMRTKPSFWAFEINRKIWKLYLNLAISPRYLGKRINEITSIIDNLIQCCRKVHLKIVFPLSITKMI